MLWSRQLPTQQHNSSGALVETDPSGAFSTLEWAGHGPLLLHDQEKQISVIQEVDTADEIDTRDVKDDVVDVRKINFAVIWNIEPKCAHIRYGFWLYCSSLGVHYNIITSSIISTMFKNFFSLNIFHLYSHNNNIIDYEAEPLLVNVDSVCDEYSRNIWCHFNLIDSIWQLWSLINQ